MIVPRWIPALLACACARPPPPATPVVAAPVVETTPVVEMVPVGPALPFVAPVGVGPEVLRRAELAPGDPESKCLDGDLARCLQARAHPQVVFHWTLYWPDDDDPAQLQARRQRVVDRLRADGATAIVASDWTWSVEVIATHPAVRGAMAMDEVRHVAVECTDGGREQCACEHLRVDQCEAHAFCNSLYGAPQGPDGSGPRQLAGCTRDMVCSDVGSHALDPTGRAWTFHNSCLPDQPGWRRVQTKVRM